MALVVNFTVGDPGQPGDGAGVYFNPAIAGKSLKVFREGLYQYTQLGSNFIIVPGSGTISFFPKLGYGERIKIIAK